MLAAVIFNEYIDIIPGEMAVAEPFGFGDSLGIAQLYISYPEKYHLFEIPRFKTYYPQGIVGGPPLPRVVTADEQRSQYIRDRLHNDDTNIDAAAKLMSIFLKRLCGLARGGRLSAEFLSKIALVPSSSIAKRDERAMKLLKELCCNTGKHHCDSTVKIDVSDNLIRIMAAVFNDDIGVATMDTVNDNVLKHVMNTGSLDNAFNDLWDPVVPRAAPRSSWHGGFGGP